MGRDMTDHECAPWSVEGKWCPVCSPKRCSYCHTEGDHWTWKHCPICNELECKDPQSCSEAMIEWEQAT